MTASSKRGSVVGAHAHADGLQAGSLQAGGSASSSAAVALSATQTRSSISPSAPRATPATTTASGAGGLSAAELARLKFGLRKSSGARVDQQVARQFWFALQSLVLQRWANMEAAFRNFASHVDLRMSAMQFQELSESVGFHLSPQVAQNLFKSYVQQGEVTWSYQDFQDALVSASSFDRIRARFQEYNKSLNNAASFADALVRHLALGTGELNRQRAVARFRRKLSLSFCEALQVGLHEAALRRRWANADADDDNIDRETFLKISSSIATLQEYEEEFVANIFDRADRGRRGRVGTADLLVIFAQMGEASRCEKAAFLFRIFDTDQDGCLTNEQILRMYCSVTIHNVIARGNQQSYDTDIVLCDEPSLANARRLYEYTLACLALRDGGVEELTTFNEFWDILRTNEHLLSELVPGTLSLDWVADPVRRSGGWADTVGSSPSPESSKRSVRLSHRERHSMSKPGHLRDYSKEVLQKTAVVCAFRRHAQEVACTGVISSGCVVEAGTTGGALLNASYLDASVASASGDTARRSLRRACIREAPETLPGDTARRSFRRRRSSQASPQPAEKLAVKIPSLSLSPASPNATSYRHLRPPQQSHSLLNADQYRMRAAIRFRHAVRGEWDAVDALQASMNEGCGGRPSGDDSRPSTASLSPRPRDQCGGNGASKCGVHSDGGGGGVLVVPVPTGIKSRSPSPTVPTAVSPSHPSPPSTSKVVGAGANFKCGALCVWSPDAPGAGRGLCTGFRSSSHGRLPALIDAEGHGSATALWAKAETSYNRRQQKVGCWHDVHKETLLDWSRGGEGAGGKGCDAGFSRPVACLKQVQSLPNIHASPGARRRVHPRTGPRDCLR